MLNATIFFYVLMLLIFRSAFLDGHSAREIVGMSLPKKALSATSEQAVPSATVSEHTSSAPYALFTQSLFEGLHHPVAVLLLQIISILVAVRIFSWLFKYLGQPGVIGEIVAGIVLGPSVLGHFSLRHSVSCFPIPPRITQYPQPDRSDPFLCSLSEWSWI